MINMKCGEKKIISECYDGDSIRRVVLSRHKTEGRDHFFLNSYLVGYDGEEHLQGYMYFNLVDRNRRSEYIGTYVNPEYRGSGVCQLLNALWIDLCFDEGIYDLRTTRRQRKPFLIYLLKGYSFELKDISMYDDRSIHILSRDNDSNKYLLFDSFSQRRLFERGKICQSDNYVIVDDGRGYTELDKIILNNSYLVQDTDVAYKKSRKVLSKKG